MPIGIGAAMLIGSAVAGGTAVAGAKMQSGAAKNAAKTQQQATDRAIAAQTQANQPYMDLGRQSAARLSQMAPQPYTQTFGSGAGSQPFQMPQEGPLASLGRPAGATGQAMPPGGPVPPPGAQGGQGMVRMQAPDGSVRPVPLAMVDELTRRGARRVG